MSDLTTITETVRLRDSGAVESPTCAVCGLTTTAQVVDGKIGEEDAWFVPCCPACHELRKPEGE